MLFQTAPAATTNYMIAGYVVIFGVMALYLISLVVRQNNLKKDLEILGEEQADSSNTGIPANSRSSADENAQSNSTISDNVADQKS